MAYDRTLVQIRERRFLDVLDLALVVVRERPAAIGLAALAGALPFALFDAWLATLPDFPPLVLVYVAILEVPWATAPLTVVLGGLMFDAPPSAWQAFKTLARGAPALFLYQFLLRALLLWIPIFYILVPTRLAFLDEVVLLEKCPWRKAKMRSGVLCTRRGGELLGQWLAQLLFGALFVAAFWLGAGALFQGLFQSEMTWEPRWTDVLDLRFHVGFWVAIEFFGLVRFLSYIDQRIRLEGWEVKLRLEAVGRALEDPRRW